MSLSTFLDMKDVIETVKPLRPGSVRKIEAVVRVEPRSNHYTLVGTAFDYLLRFEIQRRAAHAVTEPWVAERAAGMVKVGDVVVEVVHAGDDAKEVKKRVRIVEDAKTALGAYLKTQEPKTHSTRRTGGSCHPLSRARYDFPHRPTGLVVPAGRSCGC